MDRRQDEEAASATYDRIGGGYAKERQADPRLAVRIEAALGDARSVVNVGAGAGSYEPAGLQVTAVEPSKEMIAQRPPGSASVIQASAEDLPFADDSFDAAMAVSTIHHWPDLEAGLAELRRVARQRIVLVTFDLDVLSDLWIVHDYFPGMLLPEWRVVSSRRVAALLESATSTVLPVPHECSDLFFAALWARPELFLDEDVVRPMWVWQGISERARRGGRKRLADDLESGVWDERYGYLRKTRELDVGLRLVIAEL